MNFIQTKQMLPLTGQQSSKAMHMFSTGPISAGTGDVRLAFAWDSFDGNKNSHARTEQYGGVTIT